MRGGATPPASWSTAVKRYVCDAWMVSHLAGVAALALLIPFATGFSVLALAASAMAVLVGVATWEELSIRATPPDPARVARYLHLRRQTDPKDHPCWIVAVLERCLLVKRRVGVSLLGLPSPTLDLGAD